MNSMVNRQNKTADGLRSRLFDTLDALIKNEVTPAKVDSVCLLSDQILKSAKLELEIELEKERVAKQNREMDMEEKDPVNILSDELIGIAIGEYIGGKKALFNFVRYDMKKPGILSRLPIFLDDAIGGLIAGCMTKLFEEWK